jgi:hypothetical protein
VLFLFYFPGGTQSGKVPLLKSITLMYETGGKAFWLLACCVDKVRRLVTPRVTLGQENKVCFSNEKEKKTQKYVTTIDALIIRRDNLNLIKSFPGEGKIMISGVVSLDKLTRFVAEKIIYLLRNELN